MEVTINDLKHLKLSPSLIIFLKAIHLKDDSYLQELHNVSNLFVMAKYLEKLNMIKIVSNELSSNSFEIRRVGLISYLSKLDDKDILDEEIDEVLNYLNTKTGKHFKISTQSNRKFVSGRMNEGYSVSDLKTVIDTMTEEWANTSMNDYLRPETLFNSSKFQSYVNRKRVIKSEINKMI